MPEALREEVEDRLWALSDREARFRDVIDRQSSLIFVHDEEGRITFANQAFCRTFGVRLCDILGTVFRPAVVADVPDWTVPGRLQSASIATAGAPPDGGADAQMQVETIYGPRWFDWSVAELPPTPNGVREIQRVGRDVTEQRKAAAALEAARDGAEAASRAKSRFLAAISHEIRTPMNGILGFARLISHEPNNADVASYAEGIVTSGETLMKLIDEILDFSKIEAGRLTLTEETYDVRAMVADCLALVGQQAEAKGLTVVCRIADDVPPRLLGDVLRLQQVMLNLIGNAVKFTPSGHVGVEVTVKHMSGGMMGAARHAAHNAQQLQITVTDTGPGLGGGDPEVLFAEFEQGPKAQDGKAAGTGLGLAISRRLVEAMGGTLSAADRTAGGAQFTVALPLRVGIDGLPDNLGLPPGPRGVADRARRPRASIAESQPRPSARAQGASFVTSRLVHPKPRASAIADVVAIVEDDVLNARIAAVFVERLGFQARVYSTGNSALTALAVSATGDHHDAEQGSGPDTMARADASQLARMAPESLSTSGSSLPIAILVDLRLPDLDGYSLVHALRTAWRTRGPSAPSPRLIAFTANAFPEDRARCLSSGFDAFVSKPFSPDELAKELAVAAEIARLERPEE